MSRYFNYPPYIPVAKRREQAEKVAKKKLKKGMILEPIHIEGRKIATTFWGKAWCDHLESYSDFENRLPRGRSYVRNGSVIDLKISKGEIHAMVAGSSAYHAHIRIDPVAPKRWETLKKECSGKVGSLIELLSGKLSEEVMNVMTDKNSGLFPSPKEIHLDCSCPDWAELCKHLAALLYGVGARLDTRPELLFLLRSVNHEELIDLASLDAAIKEVSTAADNEELGEGDLSDIFGINLSQEGETFATATVPPPASSTKKPRKKSPKKKTPDKTGKKKPLPKKSSAKTKKSK
ncbi:MAG: SWIM zinc finger family protein [Chthoniobacterales bacterium]